MNFLDKIIQTVSPQLALKREINLHKLNNVRSYEGAVKGRRGHLKANGTSRNINNSITSHLEILRDRSVYNYKNDPSVFNAIEVITNNVVGTGIMPTPKPVIGQKLTPTEKKILKEEWADWAGSTRCDFDEKLTFYGLQALVMKTVVMQGGCLVLKKRNAKGRVPFELQLLPPRMIDLSKNSSQIPQQNGNYIVQGVEFEPNGKIFGYWISQNNPNDNYSLKSNSIFVPKSEIIHIYYKEFVEQVHGVPAGTSCMLSMRDMDEYKDAQLMAQKVSAAHAAFVSKELIDDPTENEKGELLQHIEPGTIVRLSDGESVTFNTTPTPSSYSEYISKSQQTHAAGFGISYEQFTGDMSNVNFSSGRMGWIQSNAQVENRQYNIVIPQLCDKVYEWFIEGLNLKGSFSKSAKADWTPRGRVMLDPVKEMNGLILKMKAGLMSWEEACKSQGYDPEVLFAQLIEDKSKFEEAGINVAWIIEDKVLPTESKNTDKNKKTKK